MDRRKFISLTSFAWTICLYPKVFSGGNSSDESLRDYVMTVDGALDSHKTGITLAHEHIITDFAGAEINSVQIYKNSEAADILLPFLKGLKESGVKTLIECTPAYIGRNVLLLKQLSKATGLYIVTNTGYYAAVGQKYLPRHAFTESAEQIAARWLKEWKEGIEGTGIRPGFIKLGVDTGPLKEIEKKLIRAAALTHLQSGLKIFIHTGDASAAKEEAEILNREGVGYEAFIWVHAQNDSSGDTHIELAKKGCWISLDGVNEQDSSLIKYAGFITRLKNAGCMHKLLLSHDDGFAVQKVHNNTSFSLYKNGNTKPYNSIFTKLKPALLKAGISAEEFKMSVIDNPGKALQIKICRAN